MARKGQVRRPSLKSAGSKGRTSVSMKAPKSPRVGRVTGAHGGPKISRK
jgi:hypothetical protein